MNLFDYYTHEQGTLHFSREQASTFAKQVAGDFNPIHNTDARRFCVPGDLLFAILLQQAGLYRKMEIEFAGMVTDQSTVLIKQSTHTASFVDDKGSDFITAQYEDQRCEETQFVDAVTKAYVTFSGQTFPHILVPKMREHDVMINPARPIVMYRRMSLSLDSCVGEDINLAYTGADFNVNGKKGEVSLFFDIRSKENKIGSGMKNMLLSGLRPYDQVAIDRIVKEYEHWKSSWLTERRAI